MPSKLYPATEFYKLQKEKKVARYMPEETRLNKDTKGFYVNKLTSKGMPYKMRVAKDDLVYARSKNDGVTVYSRERDLDLKHKYHVTTTPKKHAPYLHFNDRQTKTKKKFNV